MFIDFDYTISNFGEMKNDIKDVCLKLGIGKNIWDKTYSESKNSIGIYNNHLHIKKLIELNPKISQEICDAFYNVFEDGGKYKYEDVDGFLKKFQKKFNIILFTLGDEDFQLVKRSSSDIDKYLKVAINTIDSKPNALEYLLSQDFFSNLCELVFVDDKAEYFDKYKEIILEQSHLKCRYSFIWINRPGAKYSNILPHKDVKEEVLEYKDLRDIESISYNI